MRVLLSIILLLSGFALSEGAVNPEHEPECNNESKSVFASETGELRHTGWPDMLPHTQQGSYYNEFWIYHVFLENDLHLHITFSLANFGRYKSAVSGGKLFVSNFQGENYYVFREFPLEHFLIHEPSHMIRLHPERDIYLQGELPETHHVYFGTEKAGVRYLVDLDFHDIHPGYTRGDGLFRLDGERMGMFVHIPKASVTGTVAINEDTLEVQGTAYMDHTFQTDLSSKVIDKSFRHIRHDDNGFSTGYYLIPGDRSESEVIGFALEHDGINTRMEEPERLDLIHSSRIDGKSVPDQVGITYASGKTRTLEREHHFQQVSFLEEVGGLRKRLVRGFLGGEIIEYVGTGRIDGDLPMNYNFMIVH